ncbi:hypothetical protein LTR78_008965 [Recurvomyces mirabilis]|uniref:Uncharacterized protein n=1 Tax=Recurvomyces mirabilis TaxID=574656 RepID=A0AAE0TQE7_9PEZI|nr:hypothetical protein LTR78_008965 [Recurvomyces mirabilis]KAK5159766.1 hypothetical protein LTS14_001871 [Recurvomyces mirabilis]
MRLVVLIALMAASYASAAGPRVGRRSERQNAKLARDMAGWLGAHDQVKPAEHLGHIPAAINREPIHQAQAKPAAVSANAHQAVPKAKPGAAPAAKHQPVQHKAPGVVALPAAGINREPANAMPASHNAAAIKPEALIYEAAALKQALEVFAMDEIEAGFQAIPDVPEAAASPASQASSDNAAQQPQAKPVANNANAAKAQPAAAHVAGVPAQNQAVALPAAAHLVQPVERPSYDNQRANVKYGVHYFGGYFSLHGYQRHMSLRCGLPVHVHLTLRMGVFADVCYFDCYYVMDSCRSIEFVLRYVMFRIQLSE